MPSIHIVEVARVAELLPSPPEQQIIRFSALDAQWLALPLIQRVLLFDGGGGGGSIPPFASVVASLRASLAATLSRFLPLAGKIVYLPTTGDAAFDCSPEGVAAGGVRFVVAESDDDADVARLAGDADHDVGTFRRLVPELDAGELPAETFAAQVTRLAAGGLAIGVAMHHAAVDGRSVWRFLEAWAATCRGDTDAAATASAPTFDRAAIALPGGDELELARSTLRKYAPNLPVTAVAEFLIYRSLSRRTFTVVAQQMQRLKQRIASATSFGSPSPSAFVAMAALTWVSFTRSKHPSVVVSVDDEVYLFFFIDCRERPGPASSRPPVGEHYFGTCISGCLVRAPARDLLAEDGDAAVAAAATALQAAVRRAAKEPLAGWDWLAMVQGIPMERLVNMSGSTRFPAYEAADFGWGAPRRTELVTMNHDGQVVLVAGKGGGGCVQASVSLDPDHMDAFKSHFLDYLAC